MYQQRSLCGARRLKKGPYSISWNVISAGSAVSETTVAPSLWRTAETRRVRTKTCSTPPAQAVEHYEITRYGSLIAWARRGRNDVANLLQQTIDEEKRTSS
jgi:ferritin-like metal-binding protein YciE